MASDGYPLHVTIWPAVQPPRGQIVVLHGVQSHGGWYHRLGRSWPRPVMSRHFPTGVVPAPISAIGAMPDRRDG